MGQHPVVGEWERTQSVPDEGARGNTTDTCSGKHASRVTLILFGRVRGRTRCGVVVVTAVAVGVAEEAALVVARARYVRSIGTRRSVRAWRKVGGRIPLGAACGLLDVAAMCELVEFCRDGERRLTTSAGCSGPIVESSLAALEEVHRTVREDPEVLEGQSCTVEEGSPDRSLGAAGHNPGGDHRTAAVAGHIALVEEEMARQIVMVAVRLHTAAVVALRRSSHQTYRDHQERHRLVVRTSRYAGAAKEERETLLCIRKSLPGINVYSNSPVGLSLGLSSSSSNSFIFFFRKSILAEWSRALVG